MHKIMIVSAVVLLSGCVTPNMQRAASSSKSALLNQPLEKSMKALGIPDDERIIADRRIIIWRIGGGVETYTCQLKASVDTDKIVRNIDIDGRVSACNSWLGDIR